MLNIETYIQGGSIKREKIALDIKRGVITKDDIKLLVSNAKIKESFFGNSANVKADRSEWTKEYLDKLSYASVADCFNEDYLYYLSDVANYVRTTKKSKSSPKLLICISAAVIVVVAIIFILVVKGN